MVEIKNNTSWDSVIINRGNSLILRNIGMAILESSNFSDISNICLQTDNIVFSPDITEKAQKKFFDIKRITSPNHWPIELMVLSNKKSCPVDFRSAINKYIEENMDKCTDVFENQTISSIYGLIQSTQSDKIRDTLTEILNKKIRNILESESNLVSELIDIVKYSTGSLKEELLKKIEIDCIRLIESLYKNAQENPEYELEKSYTLNAMINSSFVSEEIKLRAYKTIIDFGSSTDLSKIIQHNIYSKAHQTHNPKRKLIERLLKELDMPEQKISITQEVISLLRREYQISTDEDKKIFHEKYQNIVNKLENTLKSQSVGSSQKQYDQLHILLMIQIFEPSEMVAVNKALTYLPESLHAIFRFMENDQVNKLIEWIRTTVDSKELAGENTKGIRRVGMEIVEELEKRQEQIPENLDNLNYKDFIKSLKNRLSTCFTLTTTDLPELDHKASAGPKNERRLRN